MFYGEWFFIFMVYGLWFMVSDLWLMVDGLWLGVYVSWFTVCGQFLRVYDLEFVV